MTGNIKFDLAIAPDLRARAAALQQLFAGAGRPVLVAASTHEGEELMILAAYRELRQALGDCLLVLVPRHPERFDAVFALCREQGWAVLRRSVGADPSAADDILLGDTMGELLLLLGTATVAVFGGSLVAHGGHNVLEAAAWGVPVISGPHMDNFADISEQLCAAGGMRQLQDPAELAPCLLQLLRDPNCAGAWARRAWRWWRGIAVPVPACSTCWRGSWRATENGFTWLLAARWEAVAAPGRRQNCRYPLDSASPPAPSAAACSRCNRNGC